MEKWLSILRTVVNICLLVICWSNKFISDIPMWKDVWFVLGMIMLFRIIDGVDK